MSTKTDEMSEEEKAMVGINAKTHFMGPELPGLRSWSGNRRRIKGPPGEGQYFHVMSRLTGDVPMWDALEKEAMVKLLWKMSAFCGVELLTYCVMGNHFHALVRVPDREWLAENSARRSGGNGRKSSTTTCGPCTPRTTWPRCATGWRNCAPRGATRTRKRCWSRSGGGSAR